MLDGKAVRVPPETSDYMVTTDMCMTSDDVLWGVNHPISFRYEGVCDHLDGTSQQMAIMWQSCGKGRSIVEGILGSTFRKLQACLERVDLSPVGDDFFFFFWKIEVCRDCSIQGFLRER